MKDLVTLQRTFQRHVRWPGGAMQRAVLSTDRASAARRLAVYAEAYRARLIGVLRSDFPGLEGLLGADGFERMARAYIRAHPSRTPNLRWYGQHLAGYLSRSSGWRRRPALADLARFEWALGLAFDAADASVATAEDVTRVPPEAWPAMRLRLHPSVQLLVLRSNAPEIWRAVDSGSTTPAARRRKEARVWLAWRKGHEPCYRALPPAEAWALGSVLRGRDFASLVSGLRHRVENENPAQAAAQFLRNWLAEDLICRIDSGA